MISLLFFYSFWKLWALVVLSMCLQDQQIRYVLLVIASHRAVKTARDAIHTDISYSNSIQEQKRSFKYLDVIVEESLSWNSHVMLFQVKIFLA